MTLRRYIARAIAVCFCLAIAGWIVWFPYHPERIRAAIPANAFWVSEHTRPGPRLAPVLTGRTVREIVNRAPMALADYDAFFENEVTRWVQQHLMTRYTVTAAVPSVSDGSGPAWLVASWGGVHAQILRWGLSLGLLEGFEPLPGRHPVRCYVLPGDAHGPVTTLAVYEGIVLLSFAHQPTAVRDMVARLSAREDTLAEGFVETDANDSGSITWPGNRTRPGRVTVDRLSTNAATITAVWPCNVALPKLHTWQHKGGVTGMVPGLQLPRVDTGGTPPFAGSVDWDALKQVAGGKVGAAFVLPPHYVVSPATLAAASPHMRQAWASVRQAMLPGGRWVVFLLHEDFSGRIFGVKTPSFAFAVPLRDEVDVQGLLSGVVDHVNADAGLSLLPRTVPVDGREVIVLDSSRRDILGCLKQNEKPAFMQVGHWLLAGTSLQALQGVLTAPAATGEHAPWVPPMASGAYAWLDVPASARAVRKATALFSIIRIANKDFGSPALAQGLALTSTWLDTLEPLQQLSLQAEYIDNAWHATLNAGLAR